MHNNRTVIIIGSTGGGKSALANVLAGENRFREDEGSVSVTKFHQVEEVYVNNGENVLHIKIIDTVGLGDTSLSEQEVLFRLADACYAVREGLNRVFFVTRGRFSAKEMEVYNIMRTVIFTNEITQFVTIVRTNYSRFEDVNACRADIELLRGEKSTLAEILASCGNSMIHVNNPATEDNPRAAQFRERSRNKLLTHLYQSQAVYRPPELAAIVRSIEGYMEEKTKLERENEQIKQEIERQQQAIGNLTTQMAESDLRARETIDKMMENQRQLLAQHKTDVESMNNQKKEMEAQFNRERERIREELERRRQEEERFRQQQEAIQAQIAKEREQAAAQMREMIAAQERERVQSQAQIQQLIASQQRYDDDDDDSFCSPKHPGKKFRILQETLAL